MLRHTLLLAAALTLTLPAAAQVQREFPPTALRGQLEFTAPPNVRLNDAAARLAPGARIRGHDNLLRTPASLAGQTHAVHYTIEVTSGLLMDVWLLRPEELAREPWPTTPQQAREWRFNRAAQQWSRP